GMTGDKEQGFAGGYGALRSLALGEISIPGVPLQIPAPLLIMTAIAIGASIFLNRTIYGRYMLALGRNEQAARYSGINTDRMTIVAYLGCSLLAGLGGIL